MHKIGFLTATISVFSCIGATDPPVGEEFSLAVGEIVSVEGAMLSVEFVEVIEDSRCPTGVQCVWEGNGAIMVRTITDAGLEADTLHTNLQPSVLHLGEIQLELLFLHPFPEAPGTIPTDSYRATFVTRLIP